MVGAGDFDPADHAAFAEIAEFVFGGPPRGGESLVARWAVGRPVSR